MEEEQGQVDLTTAIQSLMQELPAPVQAFLLSDERNQIARDLTQKYNLHLDQAATFEESYLHLLLGVSTPEEFVSELKGAGLGQDVINDLAADINTRVFIPLREAEKKGATLPPLPVPPPKPAPLPPPALTYAPAPTLPGSSVPAPMPQQPVPAAPVHAQIAHAEPSTFSHPQGWHPAAAVHIYVPPHPGMAQHTQPATPTPVPVREVEAAPLPPPAPVAPRPVAPPLAQAPSPIGRQYSNDPYREPV